MISRYYAGRWWTRRERLGEDETVLHFTTARRDGRLGGYVIGFLTLTAERLIWTPSPLFSPLANLGWTRWQATRSEVVSIESFRRSRWLDLVGFWAFRIETHRETVRFRPTVKGNRQPVDAWVSIIRLWADISE